MTRPARASRSVRGRLLVVAALTCGTLLLPLGPATASAPAPDADAEMEGGRTPYPGDPDRESAVVEDEDARLDDVRTIASLSRWSPTPLQNPYRLASGSAYTLVLTSRREPYTAADLLALAPQTFVRQNDGSFLLSEHVVVQPGATLRLSQPGGMRLRLASDAEGFASLVSQGGALELVGAPGSRIELTSWDRTAGAPDTDTTDGRAYVRAVGGQVLMESVDLSALGFWSGRTGGLALTGTDRPTPGQLDDLGRSLDFDGAQDASEAERTQRQAEEGQQTGGATLEEVLPAGELPVPEFSLEDPGYSYVSATLSDVTTAGNAFGLFVTGASGVDISGGSYSSSLVDGVVLHRFVTNVVVEGTSATGNAGDGFVLARATTGAVLTEVVARGNARNGITMSGLPLATGPSAMGTGTGDYGNNSVSNSRADDNGRYGIEVIGGHDIGVQANRVSGNDMGVVVRSGASEVSVVGNEIEEQRRQGIALRDGVAAATVSGNLVTGGETGVYVRDSSAVINQNTLTGSTQHAVSLVGAVAGTDLTQNTISGRGPSAIDHRRSEGVDARRFDNNTSGWTDTTPWLVTLKRLLQPLTLMWLLLGLVVVVTALRGLRSRPVVRHPYADKAPVATAQDVVVPAAAASG